nr:CPBP family intramembrane glutamic endopeptidase [Clostridioides sp.]
MNISNMKKYFLSFCGAVLIFFFIVFVFIASYGFQEISRIIPNKILSISSLLVTIFIMILILSKIYNDGIFNKSFKKLSLKNFFSYNKKYVLLSLSLVIFSVLFANVISEITTKITQGYDLDIDIEEEINYLIIGIIIYAPFIEELMFRGIFFNIASNLLDMENKVVKHITILTNIMAFMMIHYIGYGFTNFNFTLSLLLAILPRIAVSVSLVYVYLKTKDIKYNIILHMLYNSIFVLMAFI